jgi:hypothetical protein
VNKKTLSLGRLPAGEMNKLEAEYQKDLESLRIAGAVAWYKFEGLRLRLAKGCGYTPDFAVMKSNGEMEMHEVKGRWMDDARAKIKIAADIYPFRFVAITKQSKKDGGGWKMEEF